MKELKAWIWLMLLFSVSCEKVHYSEYYTETEFKERYKELHFTNEKISEALSLGILDFDHKDCGRKVEVKAPVDLNFPLHPFEVKNFERYVGYLYQLFGDPTVPQQENGDYLHWSTDSLLHQVKNGSLALQCEGISKITKEIILENAIEEVQIELIRTELVEHTLNTLYFQGSTGSYAICFDVQNGFFYPSKDPKELVMYTTEELAQLHEHTTASYFYWLPTETLNRKRNLLDQILPCNFLSVLGEDYHYTQEGSPYEYELLGPSFHKVLWFDLAMLDQSKFKIELLNHLDPPRD